MHAIALALLVATSLTPKEKARWRELVSRSMREANAGDFDKALDDATAAYEMNPAPALLYNLGQIHRLLKEWDKAGYFFDRFLATSPSPKIREKVQKLLDEVRAKTAAPAPAAPPAPPVIVTTPTPAPETTAPPAAVTPEAAPEVTQQVHKKRVWPWVAGAGGLVAAGASVAGFVQVANYYSLKGSGVVGYPIAKGAESAYGWGMPLGIAGAAVAVALFTTMGFTW